MAENGHFNIYSHGQTNFQIGEKSKISIRQQETCVNAVNVADLERRVGIIERDYRSINKQLNELESTVRNYQHMYVSRPENENEAESGINVGNEMVYGDFTNTCTNDAYDDEYDDCTTTDTNTVYDDGTEYDDFTNTGTNIVYDDETQSHTQASQNDVVTSGMTPRGTADARYDYRTPPSHWHATILTLMTDIRDRIPNVPTYQLSSSNNPYLFSMSEYENPMPYYDSVGDATIPAVRLGDDGYDPLEETEYYNIKYMTIQERLHDTTLTGDRPNPNNSVQESPDNATIPTVRLSGDGYHPLEETELYDIKDMTIPKTLYDTTLTGDRPNPNNSIQESPDNATLTIEFQVSTEDLSVSSDNRSSGRGSTTNGITRNGDFKILVKHTNGLRSERRRKLISVGPTTTIHDIKRRFLDCFGCRANVDYIVTSTQIISQTIFDNCSTLGCMGIDDGSVVHCVSY